MKLSTKALIFSVILSFVLFALPYLLPIPNQPRIFYKVAAPQDGRFLNIDGYEVFIVEKNPAARETIVLIHGFAGNHLNWRSSIETLKNKGYRVIAIDLINFGFSERDQNKSMSHADQAKLIYQILKNRNIDKASFVGHSMGGSVITHFYNNHPEMVSRLIYVAPAINITNENHKFAEFILRMPGLERWFRIIFRLLANESQMNKYLESIIINKDADFEEIKNAYVSFNKFENWDLGIINAVYDSDKNHIEINLDEEISVCVIWGNKDEIVRKEDFQSLLEIEHVEYIEIESAGHLPFEDYPEEFNENLLYCIGNETKTNVD